MLSSNIAYNHYYSTNYEKLYLSCLQLLMDNLTIWTIIYIYIYICLKALARYNYFILLCFVFTYYAPSHEGKTINQSINHALNQT